MTTGLDGGRLNFGRAFARTVLSSFSSIALFVGYLPHFFSRRKQAAHDMAAAALVLKGARETQRDPKDTLAFSLGVTAAMLALLWGARMLQFNALVAPYRAATMVEAPRPQVVPMRASTAPSMAPARESTAAMVQPRVTAPTPAPSVPHSGGEREGKYADIWRMIRASAQRNDDDVRRVQAEIEARPKSEHTNRKEARKLNQLGLEANRAKQIDEAVARFSEAHRADPRDQEICGNLGLALLDAGKLAEAEVALMEALLIEPARFGAWTVLGMVIAQRGDQAAALGALLIETLFAASRRSPLRASARSAACRRCRHRHACVLGRSATRILQLRPYAEAGLRHPETYCTCAVRTTSSRK